MLGRDRRGTPADWLVIGLGNPGEEFRGTRHNLGAEVVERLAHRHGSRLKAGRERAMACEIRLGDARVALAFPQTYMNLSGESARLLVQRHGITDIARIVVVHDELDLPRGRLKLKVGGGTAGNNGLKSLVAHLHDPGFVRVRIGIGKPPGRQQGADFVLKQPGGAERTELDIAVEEAADAVESIVAEGVERTMNRVNAATPGTS